MSKHTILRRGDKLTIYRDPVTKQHPEGTATLVECFIRNPAQEYWAVRFEGEHETHERWIDVQS